jgi:hypothetical protein
MPLVILSFCFFPIIYNLHQFIFFPHICLLFETIVKSTSVGVVCESACPCVRAARPRPSAEQQRDAAGSSGGGAGAHYPADCCHVSGEYAGTQGLGLLRLHSTFRHDLKIYASDEGRVQMTAAAFAKGLLALEGELTPILVQMVKSANTNGLLDNDCDSSKHQNM